VSGPITRRAIARGPTRRPEARRGFTIEVAGGVPLACADILGFRESTLAAADPRVQAPLRLGFLAASVELDEWLDAWSEDAEQVRRTITVRRRLDGKAITAIVTLASHGYGVDPSVAVESVSIPRGAKPPKITRSGTYSKIDVALALGAREPASDADFMFEESTFG
jgi:hypothetical protein